MHRRTQRDAWLEVASSAVLLLVLAGPLVVTFVATPGDVASGRVPLVPPCMWRTLFDVSCPTCGLTRAFSALSHGLFADALAYHRASPVLYAGWWLLTLFSLRWWVRALMELTRVRELRR